MRFNIGNESYFSPSRGLIPANTKGFDLPAGEQPSRRWTPLDEDAKDSIRKLEEDAAKKKELKAADVRAMTPERLEQLVKDRVAQVLAAQQRATVAAPEKKPKKDEPPPRSKESSPL